MSKYRWSIESFFLLFLTTIVASVSADDAAKVYKSGDINVEYSRVFVFVRKTGLGHDHAIEGKLVSGMLHVQNTGAAIDAADTLVFDMTSFDADGDKARRYVGLEGSTDLSTRKQVNANMLGKDVLNVKAFPTATFKPTSIQVVSSSKEGEAAVTIGGEFTLHGATQPVKFNAIATNVNGWLHLHGQFNILQSKFGIKPFTKAFGAVGVADELTIYGDLFIAP